MNEITTTTELQKITTGLESFESYKARFEALVLSAKDIKIKDLEDKTGFKLVKAKRIELRDAEIAVEKEAKAMRDLVRPITLHISDKEKDLLKITAEEKARLIAEEKWYEEENEKIRAAKEQEERAVIQRRIDAFAAYGVAMDLSDVVSMTDEVYGLRLADAKREHEAEQARIAAEVARVEAEKKAEADRLAKQATEQEAERKRLAEVEAKQRAEAEALAAERRKMEEEKRAVEFEKNRIEREAQAKIDAEKQAKILEEAKAAAAAQALKDAEEKRVRDEKAKIEADRLAAEKEERRIARMPDKKKLKEFAAAITGIVSPELKSGEAQHILDGAVAQLAKISQLLIKEAEGL